MDFVIGLLGAGIGSGLMAIVLACLNRKWAKEDKWHAVVDAQKLVMLDRVRFLAKQHIASQSISLEDKEHLHEMYQSYKALGGNGHLDPIMKEVDRLRVVGE